MNPKSKMYDLAQFMHKMNINEKATQKPFLNVCWSACNFIFIFKRQRSILLVKSIQSNVEQYDKKKK